jgi:hypothetical protein
VDVAKETVIQGAVSRDGAPVVGYVRLLDSTGEFTAEVPTSPEGGFRFFAAPGTWTVRALVPGGTVDAVFTRSGLRFRPATRRDPAHPPGPGPLR